MRSSRPLFVGVVLLLASACSHIHVVQQGTPNPFLHQQHFFVAPIDFSSSSINGKPEAAWVAEGKADEQKDWSQNKEDATKKYTIRLEEEKGSFTIDTAGQAAPGVVVVKPTVLSIQPGIYVGFTAVPTIVNLRLTLLDTKGQVTDLVDLDTQVDADLFHPSFNQRLGIAAESLADLTLKYLKTRTAGP